MDHRPQEFPSLPPPLPTQLNDRCHHPTIIDSTAIRYRFMPSVYQIPPKNNQMPMAADRGPPLRPAARRRHPSDRGACRIINRRSLLQSHSIHPHSEGEGGKRGVGLGWGWGGVGGGRRRTRIGSGRRGEPSGNAI